MESYTPNENALKIAEIHNRTGLNYAECKKILNTLRTIDRRIEKKNKCLEPTTENMKLVVGELHKKYGTREALEIMIRDIKRVETQKV